MTRLSLAWIYLLGLQLSSPLFAGSNDESFQSMLLPGTRLVAGDPHKNEFFIIQDKPPVKKITHSHQSHALAQNIHVALKKLQKKPQSASPVRLAQQSQKPINADKKVKHIQHKSLKKFGKATKKHQSSPILVKSIKKTAHHKARHKVNLVNSKNNVKKPHNSRLLLGKQKVGPFIKNKGIHLSKKQKYAHVPKVARIDHKKAEEIAAQIQLALHDLSAKRPIHPKKAKKISLKKKYPALSKRHTKKAKLTRLQLALKKNPLIITEEVKG